jgi:CheY-like chemotaxis protein
LTQPAKSPPPVVLLVSRDLMTVSSVTGVVTSHGGRVETATDPGEIASRAASPDCRCVILELLPGGIPPAEVMAHLPTQNRPPVIAFGSHVATALLEAARTAGCDEVVSRGRFNATLGDLLANHLRQG